MNQNTWNEARIDVLNAQFSASSPREVLRWGYEEFGDKLVMATGFGTSGIVLMHIVSGLNPDATVFYLDTDLLFPETLELKEKLVETLGISILPVKSDISLDEQEELHEDALWEKAPNACCFIRKVMPLKRFLAEKSAWITGVRRDQAISRASTRVIEWDEAHQVVKLNPLAYWTSDEVWAYIKINDLPYNELHDYGYPSIGCRPCTRPVKAGEDERAGRWAGKQKIECGIHLQPIAA